MNFYLVTLSIFLYCLSILNPAFYPPWASFISEYLSFLALLCSLPILFKKNILIPKVSIFILLVSCIPIIQYFLGQVYYIDMAFLSFGYIFAFWLAVLVGFNGAKNYKNNLTYFYGVILLCGLLSSLLAIVQWLPIKIDSDVLITTKGRPFANMAQPNHLSTFLILSVISCVHFFENKIINSKILLCFSTVLLLSIALTQSRTGWIVFFFLSLYWLLSYKRDILRLSHKIIIFHLILFIIISISFPLIKELLFKNPIISILDRASSGYERIEIWYQAVEAIRLKPFGGYGWNQSSFAQFDTIREGFIKHKLTSFHNIVLDLLVWCGIPLGILIIVFFSYLLIKFLVKSSSSAQVCAISFILVILIHALFEYPLFYSYFLLPMGFVFGFILYSFKSDVIKIHGFLFAFIFILGVFLSFHIFREYSRIPDNMVAAETHEMNERRDFVELPYKKNIFTVFVKRAEWIALYPCTKLDEREIDELSYMIKTYMIHYDLLKLSKLLAYNGYIEQSKQYLNKINYMYNKKYTIRDLQCSSES